MFQSSDLPDTRDPIVQLLLGKALLIDLPSQYGLYPYFLEPFIRFFGGNSIASITSAFAFAMVVTLSLFSLALYKMVENKLLAMVGFIAIIYTVALSCICTFCYSESGAKLQYGKIYCAYNYSGIRRVLEC